MQYYINANSFLKTNSLILLQNRNFSIKMWISLYKWPPTIIFLPYLFLDPPSVSNECLCLWIQAFKRPMYTIYLINHGQHLCNNNISISISLRFIFPRSCDKKNTMSPHTPRIIKLRNDFSMEIEAIDWLRSPPPTIKYTCSKIKSPPVIAWPTV